MHLGQYVMRLKTWMTATDHDWAWTNLFTDIFDIHAPIRSFKVRSQSSPWITPQIRHKLNHRYKLYRNSIATMPSCGSNIKI